MVTVSGFTTTGVIRKRMSDLYADFAARIKESGVFGTQTTADQPDTFASDPLVEIMASTAGSLHEVWEANELWFAQLDPKTASGEFLENLHAARFGLSRAEGQTDESLRAAILAATALPTRNDITTIAGARTDIQCAALLTSTVDAPIPNVPAPGNALVLKSCSTTIDYAGLTEAIYNGIDLGLHQFYGNQVGSYTTPGGGCITYSYIHSPPIYAAIELQGFFTDACVTDSTTDGLPEAAAQILIDAYSACNIGQSLSSVDIMRALVDLEGFTVTGIGLNRRARQLSSAADDPTKFTTVQICGVDTTWATSLTKGFDAGETWCDPVEACLALNPWEHPAFDAQFITVVEDASRGGCG